MLSSSSIQSRSFAKLFAKTHEWIDISGKIGTVGLSAHATHVLGDVTFLDIKQGTSLKQGNEFGNIEASKATTPIIAPMDGVVQEINPTALDDPAIVSKEPESKGWVCRVELSNPSATSHLMTQDAYNKYIQNSK